MFANRSFSALRDRFLQLSMREQLLLIVVVGAAIYFFTDALVFTTQKQRQQATETEIKVLQSQMVVLSAEMMVVERTRADELEQKEREYRALKQQVAQLDAAANSVVAQAPKLSKLVGDVLAAAPARVATAGIKTVPVKTLFGGQKPAAAKDAAPSKTVYRYGLDIELRGNYLDLLNYLNKLEEANPKLFWASAGFTAGTYPENTLRASVFMLSTQPNL